MMAIMIRKILICMGQPRGVPHFSPLCEKWAGMLWGQPTLRQAQGKPSAAVGARLRSPFLMADC